VKGFCQGIENKNQAEDMRDQQQKRGWGGKNLNILGLVEFGNAEI